MGQNFDQLISLESRTALVTGASGNLGRMFARTLSELKANLILVDKPSDEYDKFSEDFRRESKSEIMKFDCDFEVAESRKMLIHEILESTPAIDVMVNNAAFVGSSNLEGWSTKFGNQSLETWNRAIEVNLTSVFDLIQGLLPCLSNAPSGSIINIASIYGSRAPDWELYQGTELGNPAAYAVSKGGLIQFTRWLATTLPPTIRVNAISPGGIERNQPREFVEKYVAETALGRMASEHDLQGALIFLATSMSEYITGQILQVDGGWKL